MKNITIAGNVGKDAETRDAGSSTVTSFSVAVSGRKRDDPSTWFDVSVWGNRGQALQPHILKGNKVAVSGELSTREHNGKTYLGVNASDITLMGRRNEGGGSDRGQSSNQSRPQGGSQGGGFNDLDDDIPFFREDR